MPRLYEKLYPSVQRSSESETPDVNNSREKNCEKVLQAKYPTISLHSVGMAKRLRIANRSSPDDSLLTSHTTLSTRPCPVPGAHRVARVHRAPAAPMYRLQEPMLYKYI